MNKNTKIYRKELMKSLQKFNNYKPNDNYLKRTFRNCKHLKDKRSIYFMSK